MDTLNLFKYFGWQGGTIHQIAAIVGVAAIDLVNKPFEFSESDNLSDVDQLRMRLEVSKYDLGKLWHTMSLEERLGNCRRFHCEFSYWAGVRDSIELFNNRGEGNGNS